MVLVQCSNFRGYFRGNYRSRGGVRIDMTTVMAQAAMLQTVIFATNPIIPPLIAPTSTANDAATGAMACTDVIGVTTQYVV